MASSPPQGATTGPFGASRSRRGEKRFRCLAACGDAKVRLGDPLTGQVILVLNGHSQRVSAVAFAPDGSALASASLDGAARLWYAKSR
ncbi:MAG: WD40 repeat domain-containing protein [Isosphaeraceae bacterium]